MEITGKIIREERMAKNLRQADLAKIIGVSQDTISLWEKGKKLPGTQYVILLCQEFNISADYLLGLKTE